MRFNVAPSQWAPVVRDDVVVEGGRGLVVGRSVAMLKWGLVPSWAKEPGIGNSLINARAETVGSTPAFRAAFRSRRCVVPVSGFYEWKGQKGEDKRQPFYITPTESGDEGEPGILTLAGLWESWHGPDGAAVETFTILTTAANADIKPLHHRMPVILVSPDDVTAWLDPSTTIDRVTALLRPAEPGGLRSWPVSARVNSPGQEGPSLIQPVDPPPVSESLFG